MIAAAVAVVAGLVGGSVALATAALRRRRRANQVVPGIAGPAPASWAGSHDPEARLHRRLRDAVAALRAAPGLASAGGPGSEARAEVERHALALDQRLVAVAALPRPVRGGPLTRVTADVEALETAVGDLVDRAAAAGPALDGAVRALAERLAQLDAARAEVEALEAGTDPPQHPS